jgi:very-short-patch-repair endonuclease
MGTLTANKARSLFSKRMARRTEVLIAILNNHRDMQIAREQHWYRIPVESVEKFLKSRWAPKWIAFYQTKAFGEEAYAVNYYAHIKRIETAFRKELFPDEPSNKKSEKQYYKLILGPVKQLKQPIPSHRRRRITFISTTWDKLKSAQEINDLSDESPLEDKLWSELKKVEIDAERQEWVKVQKKAYCLDFAVYCVNGKIDIETDGDTWHTDRARVSQDNLRDNDLQTEGWKLLRFNTHQVKEEMGEYCIPIIVENIKRLGGLG